MHEPSPSPLDCRTVFSCARKDCPAHEKGCATCWIVEGAPHHDGVQEGFPGKLASCLDCAVLKHNLTQDNLRDTLRSAVRQICAKHEALQSRDRQLERTTEEYASVLSAACTVLRSLAGGDDEARLHPHAQNPLLQEFEQVLNDTAGSILEHNGLTHDLVIGICEHYDALSRIAQGDREARAQETSRNELIAKLGQFINRVADSLWRVVTDMEQSSLDLAVCMSEVFDVLTRAANGDLTGKVSTRTDNELTDKLGQVTNQTIASLRDTMSRLQTSNAELQQEVHQHRQTQDELRTSEDKFRALVENISDIVWEVDTEFHFTYVSPSIEEVLGYAPADILGRTPFEFMPQNEVARVRPRLEELFRTREGFAQLSSIHLHRCGREVVLETSGSPSFDSAGRLVGYRGVDRDITERQRAEEERKQIQEQLQQSQRMEAIGQLASGVAHDFNNILTGITGYADVLRIRAPKDPPVQDLITGILSSADRAAAVVRQLLTLASRARAEDEVVDVHESVRNTEKLLRHSIDKRIVIQTRLHAGRSCVRADSSLVESMLVNLGVNARDAMPKGGTLTFSTSVLEETLVDSVLGARAMSSGPFIRIRVEDTGEGMDDKAMGRIFEPFYSTKKQGRGTGLGLATVYGAVMQYHGVIDVHSTPGEGTRFDVYLPLTDGVPRVPPEEPEELDHGHGGVLVVDDEEPVRVTLRMLLQELGYTVFSCRDGAEAVRFYSTHQQDVRLVLLDVVMPVMGGLDCYRRIRSMAPSLPIIMMTGYANARESDQLREEGAQVFIDKPFGMRTLSAVLSRALGTAPPSSGR